MTYNNQLITLEIITNVVPVDALVYLPSYDSSSTLSGYPQGVTNLDI